MNTDAKPEVLMEALRQSQKIRNAQDLLTAAKGNAWPRWADLFAAVSLGGVSFLFVRVFAGGAFGLFSGFAGALVASIVLSEARQTRRLNALAKLVEDLVER